MMAWPMALYLLILIAAGALVVAMVRLCRPLADGDDGWAEVGWERRRKQGLTRTERTLDLVGLEPTYLDSPRMVRRRLKREILAARVVMPSGKSVMPPLVQVETSPSTIAMLTSAVGLLQFEEDAARALIGWCRARQVAMPTPTVVRLVGNADVAYGRFVVTGSPVSDDGAGGTLNLSDPMAAGDVAADDGYLYHPTPVTRGDGAPGWESARGGAQVVPLQRGRDRGGVTADHGDHGAHRGRGDRVRGRARSGAPEEGALLVMHMHDNTRVRITRPLTVGRAATSDLMLDHADVSRTHATIGVGDHGWEVRDQGSTNGVWLNGTRISYASLHEGDVVRFGGPRAPGGRVVASLTDGARTARLDGGDPAGVTGRFTTSLTEWLGDMSRFDDSDGDDPSDQTRG